MSRNSTLLKNLSSRRRMKKKKLWIKTAYGNQSKRLSRRKTVLQCWQNNSVNFLSEFLTDETHRYWSLVSEIKKSTNMLKPSAISAMIILEDVIIICPKKFVSQWLVSSENLALRA